MELQGIFIDGVEWKLYSIYRVFEILVLNHFYFHSAPSTNKI